MKARSKNAPVSDRAQLDALSRQVAKLCQVVGEELAQTRNEQQRARALIAHAARELYLHFSAMNDSVTRLDHRFDHVIDLLGHLKESHQAGSSASLVDELTTERNRDRTRFKEANSSAIQALQFEDISAQALAGCLQTLESLQHLMDAVQGLDDPLEIERLLAEAKERWRASRRDPDRQESIEEGSIELF